jgi:hypothetical protein
MNSKQHNSRGSPRHQLTTPPSTMKTNKTLTIKNNKQNEEKQNLRVGISNDYGAYNYCSIK